MREKIKNCLLKFYDFCEEINISYVGLLIVLYCSYSVLPIERIVRISLFIIVVCHIVQISSSVPAIETLKSFLTHEVIHLTEEEKKRIACHEVGHVIMCKWAGMEIEKVSIKEDEDALGHVVHYFYKWMNKEDYINSIMISLAGMVAEEIFYGNHNDWCTDDLQKARQLASEMIDSGFGNKYIYSESEKNAEAERILKDSIKSVKDILIRNQKILKQLSDELERKQEISGSDLNLRFVCLPKII